MDQEDQWAYLSADDVIHFQLWKKLLWFSLNVAQPASTTI